MPFDNVGLWFDGVGSSRGSVRTVTRVVCYLPISVGYSTKKGK